MVGPGPSADELEQILESRCAFPIMASSRPGVSSPSAKTSAKSSLVLLRRALQEEDPCAAPAHHEKADRVRPVRARRWSCSLGARPDHKIPVWEQKLSCGAAGDEPAACSPCLGYVGGWITGWQAYSPKVSAAFCRAGRADRRLHLHRHRQGASSRSGRGPIREQIVRQLGPYLPIDQFPRCCIRTA